VGVKKQGSGVAKLQKEWGEDFSPQVFKSFLREGTINEKREVGTRGKNNEISGIVGKTS